MSKETEKHPVVQVAHAVDTGSDEDDIVILSTGAKARIRSVSASLVDQVSARIKDPEIPMWFNDKKDREEPNPSDPIYLRALDDVARERGLAAMDALIMFGVDLVDPMPEDELWIKKLKLVGIEVDAEDELEKEFIYKKYIAVGADDVTLVTEKSGMSAESVAEADRTFRGKATQ
jgi:hypothetical protein